MKAILFKNSLLGLKGSKIVRHCIAALFITLFVGVTMLASPCAQNGRYAKVKTCSSLGTRMCCEEEHALTKTTSSPEPAIFSPEKSGVSTPAVTMPELKTSAVTVFIVPGISGDLGKRKIIPALYALLKNGTLDTSTVIIGTGRRALNLDQFVAENGRTFVHDYNDETGKKLIKMMRYVQFDPENSAEFEKLKSVVTREENLLFDELNKSFIKLATSKNSLKNAKTTSAASGDTKVPGIEKRRIVYLAVPSSSFCTLTQGMVASGVIESHNSAHRIAYEKPFGSDYASAHAIVECIKKLLDARQIFLIDHYRANVLASALPSIINANALFKKMWNNAGIQSMSLVFNEAIGIEGRGSFYEEYGALKDVFQNHLLQLLALVAAAGSTDSVAKTDTDIADTRSAAFERAKILRAIKIKNCFLGQYKGYRAEQNVAARSVVDTFAAATLTIDTPQWRGVDFYLQTGKLLEEKLTELTVNFRPTRESLSQKNMTNSRLICQYAPQPKITLTLVTPEAELTEPIQLVSESLPLKTHEAYANLIEHIILGNHALDVSVEEIQAQWQVIEKIRALKPPLLTYKAGTAGPVYMP